VISLVALSANGGEQPPEIVKYYDQWLGCKAPPLQFDQSDRAQYAESSYKGKRVLFYSFDAGNFCDLPNMPALLQELSALHNVQATASVPLYVIGYTRGTMWSPCLAELVTNQIPVEIEEVSRFPVVNLNNKRGKNALGEPYDLLATGPSAILIGTNGIICKIFPHAMTKSDFKTAVIAPPWTEPVQEPPTETSRQVWERTPKQNVVVARRDSVTGTILGRKHLNVDTIAKSMLPTSLLPSESYSNLLGKVLLKDVAEGQPLTVDMIGETNGVPTTDSTLSTEGAPSVEK